MRNQFIDVSSYQPDTIAFFQAAKAQGALGTESFYFLEKG